MPSQSKRGYILLTLFLFRLEYCCCAWRSSDNRLNPRGWQAARDALEQRLVNIGRSGPSDGASSLSARSPNQPGLLPEPVKDSPDIVAPSTQAEQSGRPDSSFQQLALPAFTLSLLSILVGWALRGLEGVSRQRDAPTTAAERFMSDPDKAVESDGPVLIRQPAQASRRNSQPSAEGSSAGGKQDQSSASAVSVRSEGASSCSCNSELDNAQPACTGVPSLAELAARLTAHQKPPGRDGDGAAAFHAGASTGNITTEQPKPFEDLKPGLPQSTVDALTELPATPPRAPADRRMTAAVSSAGQDESPGWLRRTDGSIPGSVRYRNSHSAKAASGFEAIDDMTLIMAALADRLCIDVDRLKPQERMQLLQMALQCCQHRESSWLHAQANEIRSSQAAAAQGTLQHHKEQAAAAETLRELDRFRTSLEDGLLAGLALMLGMLLVCGIRCGYLGARIGKCRPLSSLPSISIARPWIVLEAASTLSCYAQATSDALLACCIMLVTAYSLLKGGVLQGSTHQAPQLKLAIGLGLVCGTAGYLAVSRLGGDASRWLILWEAWIAMHVVASWQLPAVHKMLSGSQWSSVKMMIYQLTLSLSLPLAMAIMPFEGCFSRTYSDLLAILRV